MYIIYPKKNKMMVKNCPKCNSSSISKQKWTNWGGPLASIFFNSTRCDSCNYKFNGSTGKPITTTIVIFFYLFVLIIIAAIVVFIFKSMGTAHVDYQTD